MLTFSLRILLVLFCVCSQGAEAGPPLIVAHRGLLRHAPENTLANYRACLELRLGFELDVQRCKDGHLICIHDSTVNRTTNGTGKVTEMTLAEIQKLDAGSWFDPQFAGERVPTIDQVMQLIAEYPRHNVLIAVDLKAENVEADVVRLAVKHKILHRLIFIGRTIVSADVRRALLKASPEAQVARVANKSEELAAVIADRQVKWAYVRFLPSEEQMKTIRNSGKTVFIAGPTVSGNLPKNWKHAVSVGMDAILTDYPLELRAGIRSK